MNKNYKVTMDLPDLPWTDLNLDDQLPFQADVPILSDSHLLRCQFCQIHICEGQIFPDFQISSQAKPGVKSAVPPHPIITLIMAKVLTW